MARCIRCNKFSLFGFKSGYCTNCEQAIEQEEKLYTMTETDIAKHIIDQLYQKENMNKEKKSVQFDLGGGEVTFLFYNVNIDGLGSSAKKLISCMHIMRPDGSKIFIFFIRPSLKSEDFTTYSCSVPNLCQLSRLSKDDYSQIFSYGACCWHKLYNRFPAGYDRARLHYSYKDLDCDFLPRALGILVCGNLNAL